MTEYINANPQFIINGFICSGFTSAIDRVVDIGSESENWSTEKDLDSADCEDSDNRLDYDW